MNLIMRTLVRYFTAYTPKPETHPIPQEPNDPGQPGPQPRQTDVQIPQTFQS